MKKLYFFLPAVCIIFGSCLAEDSTAAAALKLLGGSSQAPVFLNCRTISENNIEFEFTEAVKITALNFEPEIKIAAIEDGNIVKVQFEEAQEPGKVIHVDLLAEDAHKNTVNVLAKFRTRNNNMPELVINEICTEYSKPKTEYIEFKTLTAGNLGAMRIFILGNSNAAKETIYEFSPVEVNAGEYMTLHLRTVEDNCIDEYGENLAESKGKDSSDTARDFWMPGTAKLIHKTCIVYVLDQDDRVLASVVLSETPDPWWSKDYFAEAVEFLYQQDAWKSADGKICTPQDAVITSGSTGTRTICRNENTENTNTAADWYITATSNATPGKPNSEKRYAP